MGSKLTKQKKKNLEEGKELEKEGGGGFSSGTWPRNKKPDFSDQKSATLGRSRKGEGGSTLERRQSFGKRLRASARNFAATRGFIDPCKSPQACGGHSRSEAPTKPSSVILGENEAKAEAVEEMVVKADEVHENGADNDVSLVVKELVEEAILKKSGEKLNEGDDQKVEAQVEETVKIEESGLIEIDSNMAITTEVQPAENVSQFLSQKSVCEEDVTPIAEVETNEEIVIANKEDGIEEEEETPCIENLQHAQISIVATTEVAEVLEREETPEVTENAAEDANETPVQVQIEAEEKQESTPVETETIEAVIEPVKNEDVSNEVADVEKDSLIVAETLVAPPIKEVIAICDPICEASSNEPSLPAPEGESATEMAAVEMICTDTFNNEASSNEPDEISPENSASNEVADEQKEELIVAETVVVPPIEEVVAICDPIISNEVVDVQKDELIVDVQKDELIVDVEKDELIVAETVVVPPIEDIVAICDPIISNEVVDVQKDELQEEAAPVEVNEEGKLIVATSETAEKLEEKVIVCTFGTNEGAETVSEVIQSETTVVESSYSCTTTVVEKQEEKIITCHFGSNEPPAQIENENEIVDAEQVEAVITNFTAVEKEVKIMPCIFGSNEPPAQIENENEIVNEEEVEAVDTEEVIEKVETEVVPQSEGEVEAVEQEIEAQTVEMVGVAILTEAEKIAKDIIDNVVAEASDDSDTEEMVEEVVKEVIEEVVEEIKEDGEVVSESAVSVEEQAQTNEEPIEGNAEVVSAVEESVQTVEEPIQENEEPVPAAEAPVDEVNEAAKEPVQIDEEKESVDVISEVVAEDIIELNNVEASKTIDTESASTDVKDTVVEKSGDTASDAGSDAGSERTDVSTDEGIAASSDEEKCNEGKDISEKEKVAKNAEDVTQTVETSA